MDSPINLTPLPEIAGPSHDAVEKMGPQNLFLKKSDPLPEKFLNFTMKLFTGTWIHVFVPSCMEIGEAEVSKLVPGIYHEKVSVCPFSLASEMISPKIS